MLAFVPTPSSPPFRMYDRAEMTGGGAKVYISQCLSWGQADLSLISRPRFRYATKLLCIWSSFPASSRGRCLGLHKDWHKWEISQSFISQWEQGIETLRTRYHWRLSWELKNWISHCTCGYYKKESLEICEVADVYQKAPEWDHLYYPSIVPILIWSKYSGWGL